MSLLFVQRITFPNNAKEKARIQMYPRQYFISCARHPFLLIRASTL